MNINIETHSLFTEKVWTFKIPDHATWKSHINNIVKVESNKSIHQHSTSPEEECNVKASRTGWWSHFQYPVLKNLTDFIGNNCLNAIASAEKFDMPKFTVTNCWINWYDKTQYAEVHNHHLHPLSVVYFVDLPDENSNFLFHNYYGRALKNHDDKLLNVEEGTIIIFNGSLPHSVSPNLSDKLRVTFAANYEPVFEEERKEY